VPLVEQEPKTVPWLGIRLGPSTFGIFDAFPVEDGRQTHLSGKVAAALMEKAPELFSQPPKPIPLAPAQKFSSRLCKPAGYAVSRRYEVARYL
jgi:hypothetical protein